MEKRVHKLTFYHPKLEKISGCVDEGYLVGGFVRDRLLGIGKDKVDIDLAAPNPEKIIPCVEEKLSIKPFLFERKKNVYTFIGRDFRIDISDITGSSIEDDLKLRDFTINALAVDIRELFLPFNDDAIVIDPTGGFEDLQEGILRPVYPQALSDDPIRILRGIRLKINLGFKYHISFINQAINSSSLLKSCPTERIREELVKVLRGNHFHMFLKDLEYLRSLYFVFQELEGIERIPPSGVHQFNLKEHTMKCVELLEKYAIPNREKILKKYGKEIGKTTLLPDFSDCECLKMVALYHDVGKPLTVKEKDGRLTFYSHDKIGAEIARKAFLRLSFGKKASRLAYYCIKYHLRPFFLYQLWQENRLTEKAIYRFFRDTGMFAFHILLLSVADFGATSDRFMEELPQYELFIGKLVNFYSERLENVKPLLTGKEIMEIKGFKKPKKCIGQIKEKLLELQALRKIKTKEDAIKIVGGFNCEDTDKQ